MYILIFNKPTTGLLSQFDFRPTSQTLLWKKYIAQGDFNRRLDILASSKKLQLEPLLIQTIRLKQSETSLMI